MFEDLRDSLNTAFKKMLGRGKLNEKNISDALREVRKVLLEADVNYKVAKDFVAKAEEEAIGREITRSITPGQEMIKVIYDNLVELLGREPSPLRPTKGSKIMLVGLQGSGKTTTAGKLAKRLSAQGFKPLLVPADPYRPAAIDQLRILGESLGIEVYSATQGEDPVRLCQKASSWAQSSGFDLLILDTAGRLHIDEKMMEELRQIKKKVSPEEILLVADAMTGQEAVRVADEFEAKLGLDGIILTKLDGDAQGGAALSMRAATGRPIRMVGVGEKPEDLEVFYPDRMASRILGMGDIVGLVEKAQATVSQEEAKKLEDKLLKHEFTLQDFLDQVKQVKKLGPLQSLMEMIPGWGRGPLRGATLDERQLVKAEAIISSMTPLERRKPHLIDGSRKKRIARGSGTTVQDINRLLKEFGMIGKMVRRMGKRGFVKFPFG